MKSEFAKELESIINKYSVENGSDTPDFILAEYLINCLSNFDSAVVARRLWCCSPEPESAVSQSNQTNLF